MSHNVSDDKDHRNSLTTFEGLKDVFNTILVNMIDQVKLLEKNIAKSHSDQIEEAINKIDSKNDYFTRLLRANLLKGIFLPINKHDLRQVVENFEIVIDLLQRVGHHMWLIEVPDWVNEHLQAMLGIIIKQLESLNKWFTIPQESNEEVEKIANLENDADVLHRTFLKKLYSESIDFKVFSQSSLLDQTLEDITDELEILSRQIHIILNEYRAMLKPLPHYLP